MTVDVAGFVKHIVLKEGTPEHNENVPTLGVYRTSEKNVLPVFGTDQAACFDLRFQPGDVEQYVVYTPYNEKRTLNFATNINDGRKVIPLVPGERVMIPSGVIFDIPENYSVRLHIRSSMAVKFGVDLVNSEGVIDSDFFHETMIVVENKSNVVVEVTEGDRIAQAELVRLEDYVIRELATAPTQRTNRVGGYGSTGVK